MDVIRLTEYQPLFLHLSDRDRHYLETRFAGRIRMSLQVVENETFDVLDPGPHVGVLTLPSGSRLEIRPKVDAANVLYMMAVAHELPVLEEEISGFDSFDTLLEFVVNRFAQLAEERIQDGLYRRYVEREENLGVVRGRILTGPDLRHNFALRHRIYCQFSELSWDVPENQVIRQVAYQMAGWPFRRELTAKLTQIETVMAEVTPNHFAASVVDSFSYSRLNYEYRPVHQLCRLLLDASSFHEDAGEWEFQTFLVNMNELFETYVAKSLKEALTGILVVAEQAEGRLDTARAVRIIPDVVIKRQQSETAVLDTKYKRLDAGEFKNHDLYQVLAYCTALGVSKGMLIYPQHLVGVEHDVVVLNSPIAIRQLTLDLGGGVADLQQATRILAEKVIAWSLVGEDAAVA